MERSRSKRSYYYEQEHDSQSISRTKPRYHHHYSHRRLVGGNRPLKSQDTSVSLSICYRILCPDEKAGGVIGKSGSIIKAFRQETGAVISVHPLVPGDDERIIEIFDSRRRDSDVGRLSPYSPAQEALLMIHERILECEVGLDGASLDADEDEYGSRGSSRSAADVTTRLVVPRGIVGCLLGKGGKIIEQMRLDTRTHIRILPRDHKLPRCISISEEIVQVVGTINAVKKALVVISSRLKDAMFRDRVPFYGRLQSPDYYFSPDDDITPVNSMKAPLDVSASSQRSCGRFVAHPPGYGFESTVNPFTEFFHGDDLVFQILCPNNKVDRVFGTADGIMEILCGDVGVDVKVTDPIPGLDESVIIVSSDEGPEDELFPAQEALLHIQSRIVDLVPDRDNIITTRLLVPIDLLMCLEGPGGPLTEMGRSSGASLQILSGDDFSPSALGVDGLVQIVGEIRAAREALIQITLRLRSYMFRDISSQHDLLSGTTRCHSGSILDATASSNRNTTREGHPLYETAFHNSQMAAIGRVGKDAVRVGNELIDDEKNVDEIPSLSIRCRAPIVTKSTLEVVIPEHAIVSLTNKSNSKLAQISEMSGAVVNFVENGPGKPDKTIRISGTPEQAERAQSLLQGFILSTQEDGALA